MKAPFHHWDTVRKEDDSNPMTFWNVLMMTMPLYSAANYHHKLVVVIGNALKLLSLLAVLTLTNGIPGGMIKRGWKFLSMKDMKIQLQWYKGQISEGIKTENYSAVNWCHFETPCLFNWNLRNPTLLETYYCEEVREFPPQSVFEWETSEKWDQTMLESLSDDDQNGLRFVMFKIRHKQHA